MFGLPVHPYSNCDYIQIEAHGKWDLQCGLLKTNIANPHEAWLGETLIQRSSGLARAAGATRV